MKIFNRISECLVKYFRRMPLQVAVSVRQSWENILTKLQGLPGEIYRFPEMNLQDLPSADEHPVEHRVPDHFNFVEDEVDNPLPQIVGHEFPERLFDHSIKEGADVAVLPQGNQESPWFGRILEIKPNRHFSIHWFERRGKSLKFRPMFTSDGTRYVSDIENDSVMCWDISLHKFDDSFHISAATFDKIMREFVSYK